MKDKNKTKLIMETWRGFLNESGAVIDYDACNSAVKARLSPAYLVDLGVNSSSWCCARDYIDNHADITGVGKARVEKALNVLLSNIGGTLDDLVVNDGDNLLNNVDSDDHDEVLGVFDDLQNPDGSGSGPSGLGPIHRSGWKIGVFDYQMDQVQGATHTFTGSDASGYSWEVVLFVLIAPSSSTASAPQGSPLDFEGSAWN